MTAPTSASAPTAARPEAIDASCRAPVLLLFLGAALWLAFGAVLALIASIKFHGPNFLADVPWLTYGRVHSAALHSIVYGFALPAGFAAVLWMTARLGRAALAGGLPATLGALAWFGGVKLGLFGILAGHATGFELLEMPRAACVLMFAGFVLLGGSALVTFQRRQPGELYVAQWFLLASLFWFAWVFSTAMLLLHVHPVRGVAQAAVGWWYAGNLRTIVVGFLGLGVIFYFLPQRLGRPLHSHFHALLAFWTLALFGAWTGIAPGVPLPAWMPATSTLATVLTVIPVLVIFANLRRTAAGAAGRIFRDTPLLFLSFAALALGVWGVLSAVVSIREVSSLVYLTWMTRAQSLLLFAGFAMMAFSGALYAIAPRLVSGGGLCPKMMRLHFWLAAVGVVLLVVPLGLGGLREGFAHADTHLDFNVVMKTTLPFLRVSTLGDTLIAAGALVMAGNLVWALVVAARAWWAGFRKTAFALPHGQPVEAAP